MHGFAKLLTLYINYSHKIIHYSAFLYNMKFRTMRYCNILFLYLNIDTKMCKQYNILQYIVYTLQYNVRTCIREKQ